MALKQQRFVVENTTVKAPRVDPKTGKDLRTAIEIVGHPVKWRDGTGKEYILSPNESPKIVAELTEGLLGLKRGGYVDIKSVTDVTAVLKNHTVSGSRTRAQPAQPAPNVSQTPEAKELEAKPHPGGRTAAAVEMGRDSHTQKSGSEYEGAVNPDGDPNFLVRVPKGGPKRRRNGQGEGESAE